MKELMIHVERIVRPVRATQRRKLRMRRELLEHLQAAVEEESALSSGRAAVITAATRRLGPPEKITRELQKTVPVIERILLAKLPVPRAWDAWEMRRLQHPGSENLNHAGGALLAGLASVLMWATCAVIAPVSREQAIGFFSLEGEHRVRFLCIFLTAVLIAGLLPQVCVRFLECAVAPEVKSRRLAVLVAFLFGLALFWMFFILTQIAGRFPSLFELLRALFACAAVMSILYLMSRRLARRQNPCLEWSTLDISIGAFPSEPHHAG